MSKHSLRIFKTYFWLSVAMFALFALCFSPMPWAASRRLEGAQGPLIGLGAAFWITGLLACMFLHLASKAAKMLASQKQENRKGKRPGLFRFFQNRLAGAADCLLIIGLIAFFALRFYERRNEILFPAITILLLLTIAHAFLNGRNYCVLRGGASAHQEKKRSKHRNE